MISAAVEIKKFIHNKSISDGHDELLKAEEAINTNSFDIKINSEKKKEETD